MRRKAHRCICKVLIIGTAVICMASIPGPARANDRQIPIKIDRQRDALAELESRVADIWGTDNVWLPSPKVWVQYEADLGERHTVDFENGVAQVQILIKATDNPQRALVLAHLRQGVRNLILAKARDPLAVIRAQGSKMKPATREDTVATIPPGKDVRVYLVREGDSLWKIAGRFRMKVGVLAKLNELAIDEILSVGRPLKVLVFSSHDLALDSKPPPAAAEPLLKDQLRMVDGRPVPPWMVKEFATEVVGKQPALIKKVIGADGIERLVVGVEFKLVSNHLEVRARKFHPLVLSHAKKYELDPALIMGIIHTESWFNPRARSRAPAYGLMQVVPHSGGREAYQRIYGKKRKLTSKYLYNPKNNIELGVAYFNILKDSYMKKISDPTSRTYCAVAAYNAGAANVGRAFIPKKSIQKAAPVINQLKPTEVYARLVDELPFKESRDYVHKVFKRRSLYQEW